MSQNGQVVDERRVERQALRHLLRLHPLSGDLPDDHDRHVGSLLAKLPATRLRTSSSFRLGRSRSATRRKCYVNISASSSRTRSGWTWNAGRDRQSGEGIPRLTVKKVPLDGGDYHRWTIPPFTLHLMAWTESLVSVIGYRWKSRIRP